MAKEKKKEEEIPEVEEEVPTEKPFLEVFLEKYSDEVKKFLATVINLLEWYPKETAKRRFQVTVVFVTFLIGIMLLMGVLTYAGKVGGEAFVFLMGTVVGYVFGFLHRYLGLMRES